MNPAADSDKRTGVPTKSQRNGAATKLPEHFAIRTPAGFRAALRKLLGQRMSVSGERLTEGELLMSLVQAETSAAAQVEEIARKEARS